MNVYAKRLSPIFIIFQEIGFSRQVIKVRHMIKVRHFTNTNLTKLCLKIKSFQVDEFVTMYTGEY